MHFRHLTSAGAAVSEFQRQARPLLKGSHCFWLDWLLSDWDVGRIRRTVHLFFITMAFRGSTYWVYSSHYSVLATDEFPTRFPIGTLRLFQSLSSPAFANISQAKCMFSVSGDCNRLRHWLNLRPNRSTESNSNDAAGNTEVDPRCQWYISLCWLIGNMWGLFLIAEQAWPVPIGRY